MRESLILTALLLAAAASLAAQAPDRSKPPVPGPPPTLKLPTIQKQQLSNGLPVWVVEQHEVPVAQVNLVVLSGSADDPAGKYGVASLATSMLMEGAGSRSSLETRRCGGLPGRRPERRQSSNVGRSRLHAPVARLADALPIMADVAQRPTFAQGDLERLRQQRLTSIVQARDDPNTIAALAFARVLYGTGHRFGTATTGTAETMRAFTARRSADLLRGGVPPRQRHNHRRRRRHAASSGAAAREELRQLEGGRRRRAREAADAAAAGATRGLPRGQAGRAAVADPHRTGRRARSTPDYFPLQVMNTILGGSFSSRLNLNLREKHGYTYGANSFFDMRVEPGPFTAFAGVQTDKTSEALKEFFNELPASSRRCRPRNSTRAKNYVALRVAERLRDDRRHLAPPRGDAGLPPARRLLLALRPEHRSGHRCRRAARGAEVPRSRTGGRRHRRRSEGDRAWASVRSTSGRSTS